MDIDNATARIVAADIAYLLDDRLVHPVEYSAQVSPTGAAVVEVTTTTERGSRRFLVVVTAADAADDEQPLDNAHVPGESEGTPTVVDWGTARREARGELLLWAGTAPSLGVRQIGALERIALGAWRRGVLLGLRRGRAGSRASSAARVDRG